MREDAEVLNMGGQGIVKGKRKKREKRTGKLTNKLQCLLFRRSASPLQLESFDA
jgi:hypothetical protein